MVIRSKRSKENLARSDFQKIFPDKVTKILHQEQANGHTTEEEIFLSQ